MTARARRQPSLGPSAERSSAPSLWGDERNRRPGPRSRGAPGVAKPQETSEHPAAQQRAHGPLAASWERKGCIKAGGVSHGSIHKGGECAGGRASAPARAGVPFHNVPSLPLSSSPRPRPGEHLLWGVSGSRCHTGVSEPGLSTSEEQEPGSGSVCIYGPAHALPWWLGQTPPLLPGAGVCSGCAGEACGALSRPSTHSETGRERDSLLKSKGLSKPCALVAPSTRGPAHCPSALRTTPGWEKPFRTEVTGMNGPTPKSRLAWNAAPQSIRCLPVRPWTPLA